MDKTIIIRYGELYLKGRNKKFFEQLLHRNIINALKGINCKFYASRSRYFVDEFAYEDTEEIIYKLKKVFGIHSLSVASKIATDIEVIKSTSLDLAPAKGSFRVSVNRADKTLPYNSIELSQIIGGHVADNRQDLTVDLHNPEHCINVDIRENKITYIYTDSIMGAGGMPVGSASKGLLLLSGGIDSPVAGYMMAKRGMQINALHFHSYPYTSARAKQKVKDLADIMSAYCGKFNLYVVSFTKIQEAIHEFCREDFMITVMRRIMVKIAERVANYHKCGAIITGESLGQVASQTLESIISSNDAVEVLPIFRPLIGMDKSEIIAISKNIEAFETSIQPYEDCCTVFLPKNPIIKPNLKDARAEEAKIPNIDELIRECIESIEVIKI